MSTENPEENTVLVKSQDADEQFRKRRLKGMRIRDEFLCPITQELLRDPVVISDGHTYEKNAIEKWLRSKNISPMTGEEMVVTFHSNFGSFKFYPEQRDKIMTQNINLKKLIKDMIDEGGAGLYTMDLTNQSRLFDVTPEKVLLFKCLGPPESDWNQQVFQVSPVGCFGGRKLQDVSPERELMLFRDTTVSRKHFEITAQMPGCNYFIRDLGSAGGTFIRIASGERKLLHPGTILLMGKHQFLVSSVDEGAANKNKNAKSHNKTITNGAATTESDKTPVDGSQNDDSLNSASDGGDAPVRNNSQQHDAAVRALVTDAERLIQVLEVPGSKVPEARTLGQRMRSFHERVAALVTGGHSHSMIIDSPIPEDKALGDTHNSNRDSIARLDTKVCPHYDDDEMGLYDDEEGAMEVPSENKVPKLRRENTMRAEKAKPLRLERLEREKDRQPERRRSSLFRESRKCTLTCFTPDGSPLQGTSFVVGPQGGTIGRKPTNTIALCITHPVENIVTENGVAPPVRVTHIDSAVSGEHARIDMDPVTGDFYITDGASGKPSTNGTWYRLSGPYQESPPHAIRGGMEILIGTIRFQVSESMTIAEHAVVS